MVQHLTENIGFASALGEMETVNSPTTLLYSAADQSCLSSWEPRMIKSFCLAYINGVVPVSTAARRKAAHSHCAQCCTKNARPCRVGDRRPISHTYAESRDIRKAGDISGNENSAEMFLLLDGPVRVCMGVEGLSAAWVERDGKSRHSNGRAKID